MNDQGIKMYDIFEDPQNGPVCQPCPACLSVTACCLLVFSNAAFTFRAVTVQRRHVRQELSMDRHFKITYWMNCTHSSLWLQNYNKYNNYNKRQNQDNDDLYNGGCSFIENWIVQCNARWLFLKLIKIELAFLHLAFLVLDNDFDKVIHLISLIF